MKLKQKQAKLQKTFTHVDNRKKDKVKRGDYKEYVAWFHEQPLQCLECGTLYDIEADHINPQDDRTIVPFCSYCHRGDNLRGRKFLILPVGNANNTFDFVTVGYYRTRGTRTAEFKAKWSDEVLLKIAERLYQEYKKQF